MCKLFRNLIPFLIFSLLNVAGYSQTISVAGNISTNTTWNADTIKITGDVVILNGSNLTINPGTYVEFQGYYSILCLGKIQAVGNATDSIKFAIHDTTGFATQGTQAGGWLNINIQTYSGGVSPTDTNIFKYCSFSHAKENAILKSNGEVIVVENCSFYHNYTGIWIYLAQIPNQAIIKNNRFYNNRDGALLLKENCIALISNNTFQFNSVGISTLGSKMEIKNNTISNCLTGIDNNDNAQGSSIDSNIIMNNQIGISITNDSNHTVYSNNIIKLNGTLAGGIVMSGGIVMANSSSIIINNNISNNTAIGGAAIFMQTPSDPLIAYNTISNNYSAGSGCGWTDGGAILSVHSNPKIINNIIANNETESYGGAITANDSSFVTLINNTIVNNKANSANGGGGLSFGWNYIPPVLKNNIIWGNVAPNQNKQIYVDAFGQAIDVDFCLLADTNITYSNPVYYQDLIVANPLFANPSSGAGIAYNGLLADWSLQQSSPCINAGTIDTTGLGLYSFDLAGNQRVQFGRVDIGAFESNSNTISSNKNELSTNSIIVFPNPTQAIINLIINSKNSGILKLTLTDISGKILIDENIDDMSIYLYKVIDLAAFNNGIYALKLSFENGTMITKSIVKF